MPSDYHFHFHFANYPSVSFSFVNTTLNSLFLLPVPPSLPPSYISLPAQRSIEIFCSPDKSSASSFCLSCRSRRTSLLSPIFPRFPVRPFSRLVSETQVPSSLPRKRNPPTTFFCNLLGYTLPSPFARNLRILQSLHLSSSRLTPS